jgi:hypothetical protein
MGDKRTLTRQLKTAAARPVVTWLFAGGCVLMSALAMAQDVGPPKPREDRGLFGNIGRWFDETFNDAGKNVQNFGHEAGMAAKSTVDTAKDAAGAVARIPTARVVTGHEKCKNAPNGAPDCQAAAMAVCKGKGFESGKSLDMTTAEVCPPKVLLSGRSGGAECRDETFVSRALCQ